VPHSEVETREQTDAELLSAVAAGDDDAYGLLWRRHEAAARRLAAQLTRHGSVDDLVSEAFARVLRAVKSGAGPSRRSARTCSARCGGSPSTRRGRTTSGSR
jgi:Sigma-70 region 2.